MPHLSNIYFRWHSLTQRLLLMLLVSGLIACGGSGSSSNIEIGDGNKPVANTWAWVSGANTLNQAGNYGLLGSANSSNQPGARIASASWQDASGHFWLFGGKGNDSGGALGNLNDLWRWDGTNWTWVSGSNSVNQAGTYGALNTPNAANIPGARLDAVTWIDASGDFWLFGGEGYDSTGNVGDHNDLWRWDGTDWSWMSGSNLRNQSGVYGTQGTANISNVPGGRTGAISWIDASGEFWLFGGWGYDSGGALGNLSDLWRWDGSQWTWMSGSNLRNLSGSYGTQGTADNANVPGARNLSVSWIDASGNFWLFGGFGRDSVGASGNLNDLWRWDGADWTWVSGSNSVNQSGTYGTLQTADAANRPGGRSASVSWVNSSGDFWLFGGSGYDSSGNNGRLNDLWRWDGTQWSWMSGSSGTNQSASYGTLNQHDATNVPGARSGSAGWIDSSDHLWMLGGKDTIGHYNDLWRYKP